jgi:hypothetical protein
VGHYLRGAPCTRPSGVVTTPLYPCHQVVITVAAFADVASSPLRRGSSGCLVWTAVKFGRTAVDPSRLGR